MVRLDMKLAASVLAWSLVSSVLASVSDPPPASTVQLEPVIAVPCAGGERGGHNAP